MRLLRTTIMDDVLDGLLMRNMVNNMANKTRFVTSHAVHLPLHIVFENSRARIYEQMIDETN